MREIRNVWRMIGRIFFLAGIGFLALYAVLGIAVNFFYTMALGINGAVFAVIGGIFLSVVQSGDIKRARLKREGLCYEAEIVRVVPNIMIRIGVCVAANAECRYINSEGKTCLVRSGLFLIDNPLLTVFSGGPREGGKLAAKVYVSGNDPRDYYVEIRENDTMADMNADYDYR